MTFNKTLLTAALLTVGGFAAMSANADTVETSFKVNMNITETCKVVTGSNIDLGDTIAGTSGKTGVAATAIKVNCSKLTPYDLGLSTTTGIVGKGIMLGGVDKLEEIPYEMFSDAGYATTWGNTVKTNTVSGTGDGMTTTAKEHTVYIKAGGTDNVSKGAYDDVITVVVNY